MMPPAAASATSFALKKSVADLKKGSVDLLHASEGSAIAFPIAWYVTYSLLKPNPVFCYKGAKIIIFSPVARVGTGET